MTDPSRDLTGRASPARPRPRRATLAAVILALALAAPAPAVALDLPRPSPLARVSQVVGLTEVTVEYSSPAVRGRRIWGGLVPYGTRWRTGANQATRLTVSRPVTIGGVTVPPGSYSLHTIPGPATWVVIVNKNPTASSRDYRRALDLVRVSVRPRPAPPRERMTFLFADTTESTTSLELEWAGLRVALPITTQTQAQVAAALTDLEQGTWRPFNAAARYLLEHRRDYRHALALVDRSLGFKEEWLNLWTKAQILAAQGQRAAACPYARRAQALGTKAPSFFFAADVKRALGEWRCP